MTHGAGAFFVGAPELLSIDPPCGMFPRQPIAPMGVVRNLGEQPIFSLLFDTAWQP